jgi:hypothetical protein
MNCRHFRKAYSPAVRDETSTTVTPGEDLLLRAVR